MKDVKITEYRDIKTRLLKGNPLAEAIHERLEEEDFEIAVGNEIYVPEDINEFSDSEKELEALSIMNTVSPTSIYYEAYCDFYNVLMMGYADRNPTLEATIIRNNTVSTGNYKPSKTTSECMIITGLSGVGKSTLIDSVVSVFDQTIPHSKNGKYEKEFTQITYIKCDIPGSANIKSVCRMIVQQIDFITGEKHWEDYKKKRLLNDEYIERTVALCSTQMIGVIILDEVQNLSLAKAEEKAKILSLIHKLTNEAKVPVINVGTTKAIKVFQSEFMNIRRLGLPVDLLNFFEDEDDWKLLVEYAWDYQLIESPLPLDDDIRKVIYRLTVGIPHCLFFLISQANVQAIRQKKTCIDGELLEEIYRTKFKLLRPALLALKIGKTQAYDDLYSLKDNLDKAAKKTIKELFKIADNHKFSAEVARELAEVIEGYLSDYKPTKTEALIYKKLLKTIDVQASRVVPNENGMELPL
jgi:energy-coupling factor transporter ATP-binding protein EcfA2